MTTTLDPQAGLDRHAFYQALHSSEPTRSRTSPLKFSKDDIHAIHAAQKRGLSWKDISDALAAAGGQVYKRPESLAQTVTATAKAYGIPLPFPERAGRRKKAAPEAS